MNGPVVRLYAAIVVALAGSVLEAGARAQDKRNIDFLGGWAAIARDGERLGYVPMESLLPRR
jgi:hypothetical protein